MDVVDIGTITVNTTLKTLVAAKAVFQDASHCFHQKVGSMTENVTFVGMRILRLCKNHAVHVAEHLQHACLSHAVFHSALVFFHVLLSLHVRELFCLVYNTPCDLNIYRT